MWLDYLMHAGLRALDSHFHGNDDEAANTNGVGLPDARWPPDSGFPFSWEYRMGGGVISEGLAACETGV
jgi:hypothetical protein